MSLVFDFVIETVGVFTNTELVDSKKMQSPDTESRWRKKYAKYMGQSISKIKQTIPNDWKTIVGIKWNWPLLYPGVQENV